MSFHVFRINEVYSNADGTIQFMEFVGEQDNQNFWDGHQITSTNGVLTNTYDIAGNLPSSSTNGMSVLLATQGFVDLGLGVTPDYIIPSNFLFTADGTIDYIGMIHGTISYAALPTDGVHSIDENGISQVNSPTNTLGEAGEIPSSNHDPVVAHPTADQVIGAGQSFGLTAPANTFTDSDGDTLSYSATRSSGAAPPAWLGFDGGTRTFSGVPGATDTGTNTLRLIADDGQGGTAFDQFKLTVISGHVITGDALANDLAGTNKNDLITGLEGNDVLNGGAGKDTMIGGAGNDTYFVNVATDVVTEFAPDGTDTVKTGIDYTLGDSVERLTLTGTLASDALGNVLNNLIKGNAAGNTLKGFGGADTLAGGAGADTLIGGGGNDVFLFDTAPATGQQDRIQDFHSGQDRLQFENSIFTSLAAPGALSSLGVQMGLQSAITGSSGNAGDGMQDFIKYATDTGRLYYDANGTAGGGLQFVATLFSAPATPAVIVPASDLFVI